jgi:hypothetical protein
MDRWTIAALALGALALLAAGVTMLALGLRGRRTDDHPICRRCGFDLHGLTNPRACPECGHLLDAASIRMGNRRMRWGLAGAGMVLLLILLAGIGSVGVASARGYDWNTVKPQWLLEQQAQSADMTDAEGALEELAKRLAAGEVPADRTGRLVERGLESQANDAAWVPGWGTVIEKARTRAEVTDAQWQQYLRTAFQIKCLLIESQVAPTQAAELAAKPKADPGKRPFAFAVTVGPTRVGDGSALGFEATPEALWVGDRHFSAGVTGRILATGPSRSTLVLWQDDPLTIEEARALKVRVRARIIGADGQSVEAEWAEESAVEVQLTGGR